MIVFEQNPNPAEHEALIITNCVNIYKLCQNVTTATDNISSNIIVMFDFKAVGRRTKLIRAGVADSASLDWKTAGRKSASM